MRSAGISNGANRSATPADTFLLFSKLMAPRETNEHKARGASERPHNIDTPSCTATATYDSGLPRESATREEAANINSIFSSFVSATFVVMVRLGSSVPNTAPPGAAAA
eukprot:CAMPEP_0174346838 /NCGR_PEP_ID=MMETSP0811_2-20130205/2717_1 /TAXON_ID=73025 ORGANISM="Eutreptiella gymnastica-like, Strain CCMP1594" /NCGR_SAMPLE_ID=MMETSP0811_2 /ASSEMBLY_ACC=CAM_ASM_000667 /LENGTH=108 /DNA_ID=CAMNT_0015471819 /DNA_START=563 /DNA_END=889 /DNA_ORIENTATION=+